VSVGWCFDYTGVKSVGPVSSPIAMVAEYFSQAKKSPAYACSASELVDESDTVSAAAIRKCPTLS